MRIGKGRGERGFSLIEVLVATVILMVGVVAVAQLAVLAVSSNGESRSKSDALVVAQREMDALLDQPISQATFNDPQGIACPAATLCNLGNAAAVGVVQGNPVAMVGAQPHVSFAGANVAGYGFIWRDPNDSSGASYDVRWSVISPDGFGKRFILGVRPMEARNGAEFKATFFPVELDSYHGPQFTR